MIHAKQNEQVIKIGNWIAHRLDRFELVLVAIFALGLIVKIVSNIPINVLISLTLTTLATLYFFNGHANVNDENAGGLEIFIFKITSWGCSVTIVGILFRIGHWPGYNIVTTLGCATLIISFLVILISKLKKSELKLFTSRWILRIIVIVILGLTLKLLSTETLMKIGLIK